MGYRERLINPESPLRLSGVLLPEAKKFYDTVLTDRQQIQYELKLHGVQRMGGLRNKGLVPPGFKETNLEHTYDVLAKEKRWSSKYPFLSTYMVDAQKGTIVHDSGEINPAIDDVQPTNRTPKDERRKRLEPFAARIMMKNFIVDNAALELALAAYNRYQTNESDDVATQIARFADKAQGTVDHADVVFNIYRHPNKMEVIAAHLIETIPQMLVPALNIFLGLDEMQARIEARDMIISEFDKLARFAPRNIVNSFKRGFAA